MNTSSTQIVEIERPVYGGAFLGRVEGKAVFVPLTLPGEKVRVRIVEEKRGYSTAAVEEIVAAAPERSVPECRHFGACGGCHYQHTDYATQLKLKQAILRETLKRGGVNAPAEIAVLAADPWGYRNRIRLAFDAMGNAGYRGSRSRAVIPIIECPIAAPLLMDGMRAIAETTRKFSAAPRPAEIALFCNADETALLASVFVSSPATAHFNEFAHAIAERMPALSGIELVVDSRAEKRAETRLSRTVARWGTAFINYHVADFDYRVEHGAFFQVNRWLVDALVDRVTSGHQGALAWDLFAGVGLFARKLAERFGRVKAVELAPGAIKSLEENLRGTTGTAVQAESLAFLRRSGKGERPDLIVVDPPRTGLDAEIAALLVRVAAPAMVYVSCDPATLARDLKSLVAGGYSIESIALADLFPQTFHLETVVQLRRA